VYISGCGDASKEVLHAMLSTVGSCSVQLVLDEESGAPTGEASATYASASAAENAIKTFDGSRFDDGLLQVSVSKRAAQGSLTTRGKGKGRGKGGGMAFSERQRDLISEQRLSQAQDEKDEFAAARRQKMINDRSGGGRGGGPARWPDATAGPPVSVAAKPSAFDVPAGPATCSAAAAPATSSTAASSAGESKKRKLGGGLPGMLLVRPAGQPASQPEPLGAKPAVEAEKDGEAKAASAGGGLLGLAGYGSVDDDDDE